MRKSKKMIALLLCVAMFASLGAGCGSKKGAEGDKPTTGNEGTSSTTSYADVQKPDSIHWWVHSGMNEENGVPQWEKEFERLTNIDLNLEIISNNEYYTLLELAFASDTVPEVFDLSAELKLATYAKQGAVADLTDLVKESGLYDKVDQSLWDAVSIDGKIYGIPMEIASGAVTYIRKDWLDRLGLSVPKTYDEFTEVLRQFRDNIEECKVPLTSPGLKNNANLPEFYQGASYDFVKVGDTWVDGFAQDNMAEALKRMRDAYADGLLDLEVVTNTTSNCRDQWYSGSVGVFNYWGGLWGQTLTERLQINVPDAEVLAMDPIEGSVYYYSVPSVLCISSEVSDEKTKQIFKYFFDYMHDGKEGQVLFESGVEGLHWEQDGENRKPLPTLSNPDEVLNKAWITPWMAISPLELTDKNIELPEAVSYSLGVLDKYAEQKVAFPVSNTLNKIVSDLTLVREEILAKVVMGDMTVEEGMEKYKKESEELNVAKVLEELNGN